MIIINNYFRLIILHLPLQKQSMNKLRFFLSILGFLVAGSLFSQRTLNPIQENNGFNTIQNDGRNYGKIIW